MHGWQNCSSPKADTYPLAPAPAHRPILAAGFRRAVVAEAGPPSGLASRFMHAVLRLSTDPKFIWVMAPMSVCQPWRTAGSTCAVCSPSAQGCNSGAVRRCQSILRASGLHSLAERVSAAPIRSGSACAVAGFSFARPINDGGTVCLGDAFAVIPPFTGNGMAMAFIGAALALDPLVA